MNQPSESASTDCTYWIAVLPADKTPLRLFGPFTLSEANTHRAEWTRKCPPAVKISSPFRAVDFQQAEQNAAYYLPGDDASK